jgi:hypothetical protein
VAALGQEISAFAKGDAGNGSLEAERALLGRGLEDVQAMIGALAGNAMAAGSDPSRIYRTGQHTTRLLFAIGDVVVAWLLLRQAEVALHALTDDHPADVDFYQGKVAAARWFALQVLPHLAADRAIVDATDDRLMELSESAF